MIDTPMHTVVNDWFGRTGGPARPVILEGGASDGGAVQFSGMTMRDYFAAQALPALISAYGVTSERRSTIVARAYEYADLMLEEIRRGDPKKG